MSGGSAQQPTVSSTLADFDWKVHHVLASNKVSTINAPLVRLQLHLKDSAPDTPPTIREVCVELSKEELDSLIAQLETAKGALDQIKSATD